MLSFLANPNFEPRRAKSSSTAAEAEPCDSAGLAPDPEPAAPSEKGLKDPAYEVELVPLVPLDLDSNSDTLDNGELPNPLDDPGRLGPKFGGANCEAIGDGPPEKENGSNNPGVLGERLE